MANTNSQNVMNHIQRRKKDLISVFGGECCLCHFNAFQSALEFHHVDPTTKEFGITDSNSVTKALDKQLVEMKKCILVCANCHRGIHAEELAVPENFEQFYNEEVAQQLIEANNLRKHRPYYYCSQCGKVIAKGSKMCEDCAHKTQRKSERPDRATLKELIRNTPFVEIGRQFNVSDNAIRKWCKAENLPTKKIEINNYSDAEWEKI